MKCGADHPTARCTDRSDPKLQADVAKVETSAFALMAAALEERQQTASMLNLAAKLRALETQEALAAAEVHVTAGALLANEAVMCGKAALDCGATSSLGSVGALERVKELNVKRWGVPRTQILPQRPNVSFGNGASQSRVSTARCQLTLDGKGGSMDVAALETDSDKDVPMLLSVKSLRALGAIIDFENDTAIFTKINSKEMLERSSAGHQLLPTTTDAYESAELMPVEASSLRDLVSR
jgi:hypothetical protein